MNLIPIVLPDEHHLHAAGNNGSPCVEWRVAYSNWRYPAGFYLEMDVVKFNRGSDGELSTTTYTPGAGKAKLIRRAHRNSKKIVAELETSVAGTPIFKELLNDLLIDQKCKLKS